ncbi:bZIP transcription factor family protein [Tripterygium wilfordii]|uniref:BZIP transcription factor family protein n=1 Tax=Tripterygium wilfordii TaxID=458696 RepID=A0A7J7E399_TRIWF|nr:bZIP transcription factor 11-like [Tripterygium wilfordii]KAF5753003.1 bZIP transcription factor family protein [Tripterygium wilfordii]
MASSSGTSSGYSKLRNSSSEEDLQQVMDNRKRKRMLSNRESARRSRQRKQKLVDDLMEQVGQLRQENNQILTTIDMTTQLYLNVEAENSVLRAQMAELTQRLQSLNEIMSSVNVSNGLFEDEESNVLDDQIGCFDSFMTPWSYSLCVNQQPIMY